MSVPQDSKTRASQKKRRTKKLAAWRAKQAAQPEQPATAPKKGG